jgi:aspartate kinase
VALIVQKYGGTSVGDIERIRNVAKRVINTYNQGNDVVVVVSAMSGETDRLVNLSKQMTPSPSEREYDVLVATGEQVSVALLSMAFAGSRRRVFSGVPGKDCNRQRFQQGADYENRDR